MKLNKRIKLDCQETARLQK